MYQDLAEAIEDARENGYEHLFEVEENCLTCKKLDRQFPVEKLHIISSYHFDQGTDPGDDSSLYLIESDSGIKGYLVTSYTTYTNREKAEFLDKLLHENNF